MVCVFAGVPLPFSKETGHCSLSNHGQIPDIRCTLSLNPAFSVAPVECPRYGTLQLTATVAMITIGLLDISRVVTCNVLQFTVANRRQGKPDDESKG